MKTQTLTLEREYLIIRPEKISWFQILSLFILRRNLAGYKFVETNSVDEDIPTDFITALTILIQKILESISKPLKWFGEVVEFSLNLLSINGGIFRLLIRIFTVSVEKPNPEAANYRTVIGHIDPRVKLSQSNALLQFHPFMDAGDFMDQINIVDLMGMAAKVAYENPAFIQNVVTNVWKMNFVQFFNGWNKFLNDFTTQAFVFTNKAADADLIVVALRGTSPFDALDWSTDIDLSRIFADKLGFLHIGFLKALGLQNELSFLLGFPKELIFNDPKKPYAYYAIRDRLRSLLKAHPNAKIVFAGHSLGGALACVFPSLLSYHNESDICKSMYGIFTYGQPRVGDSVFKLYMDNIVRTRHYRMVYRYDVVPRIPFDSPPLAMFKHTGTCVYYDGWYQRKVMDEAPNQNYFDLRFIVSMHVCAIVDLFKALFIGFKQGKDYREGVASILYRCVGIFIPGLSCHSPRDYIHAGRLSKISQKSLV